MSFYYDPATTAGQVRLLITDTDVHNPIFTDEEIDAFLLMEESNVRRSAAMALDTIATNEALTLKVIRVLDITTDGAKLADSLMTRAAALRAQADREEDADGGGFDIAEMVVDDFTARQRLEQGW